MTSTWKRVIGWLTLIVLLLTTVNFPPIAEATSLFYGDYTDVATVKNYSSSCPSMQGLAVGSQMMYTIKIDGDDAEATIAMTDKDSGKTTQLYDASDGDYYFSGFGHANDMAVWGIDGYSNIFITSTNEGSGAITRLKRNGSGLTRVASYSLSYNGVDTCATAFDVMSVSGGMINFITKLGQDVYTGSVSVDATSADIPLTKLCTIDKSKVVIKGEQLDLTSWVNQGFGYYDNTLFVPVTGPSGQLNRSVVMVYTLEGVPQGATIYPTDALVFRVTSGAYSALFEIESCDICSGDKKLYFNTNRRVTDSDTNHDGVSSFDDYVYSKLEPDINDIKSYTVRYNANGGSGAMDDTWVPYGVNTKLSKNTFTRNGYTFVGWTAYRTTKGQWYYTDGTNTGWYAEGSQPAGYTKHVYKDGVGVAKTTSVDKDLVQLYAQWTPTEYTATFSAGEGTGSAMSDMNFTATSTSVVPECTYVRSGYTFNGWQISGLNQYVTPGTSLTKLIDYVGQGNNTGNTVNLIASWSLNSYTINWDTDGDGTADTTTTAESGTVPAAPAASKDRNGCTVYTFAGWTKVQGGTQVQGLTAANADTTYYA
ncbi:MAG: InlB B-repeat-containing protein, partial [Oscillospiraceae bacterium]|nr:InlB B-repeat-containing protein [Oscillospiraceae bacterium]